MTSASPLPLTDSLRSRTLESASGSLAGAGMAETTPDTITPRTIAVRVSLGSTFSRLAAIAGSGSAGCRRLDPLLPAKERELRNRRHDDHRPRERVPVPPVQLGQVVEVLPVDADEKGREEQQRRDHGELLDDLVLLLADLRLVELAGARDQLPRDVERLRGAKELVVRIREVELERAVEHLVVAD